MEDLISVIVPVYNSEPYLRQCLDSLAAQTYPHIEFILVNDGSRDHSGAICESYAGRDSRFRYFAKENGGVSSARNLGLEQAGGAYIGFCDADDWVEPEMYETMYRHLCETSADIAMEGYCINDSQPAEEAACTSEILTAGNVIRDMIDGNIYGYVWNRLLRAELTKKCAIP